MKNKRQLISLPNIFISIVLITLLIYYKTLNSPLEKVIVLMIIFFVSFPIIIFLLSTGVKQILQSTNEIQDKSKYSRKVDKNGNLILKKDLYKKNCSNNTVEKQSVKKEEPKRKPKVVTTEGYQELKNIIIATSKNKLLDRETILEFKAELRNRLGVHYECYKNMTFKNDLHEIYTLIKSSKFTTEDYNEMTEWISNHLNLDNIS